LQFDGFTPEDATHRHLHGIAITAIKAALAQPAHSEWNAALDEAAARIGEIKGFGQATQDSFAVFIKGLKR
jgi:hypothetical protein